MVLPRGHADPDVVKINQKKEKELPKKGLLEKWINVYIGEDIRKIPGVSRHLQRMGPRVVTKEKGTEQEGVQQAEERALGSKKVTVVKDGLTLHLGREQIVY